MENRDLAFVFWVCNRCESVCGGVPRKRLSEKQNPDNEIGVSFRVVPPNGIEPPTY